MDKTNPTSVTTRKPCHKRILPVLLAIASGTTVPVTASTTDTDRVVNTYAQDLEFLQRHIDVIELHHSGDGARLCLVPA